MGMWGTAHRRCRRAASPGPGCAAPAAAAAAWRTAPAAAGPSPRCCRPPASHRRSPSAGILALIPASNSLADQRLLLWHHTRSRASGAQQLSTAAITACRAAHLGWYKAVNTSCVHRDDGASGALRRLRGRHAVGVHALRHRAAGDGDILPHALHDACVTGRAA